MVKQTCVRLGIDFPKHSFFARGIHFAIVVGPPPSVNFAQKDFAFVMAGPVFDPGRSSYHGLLSERRKSEKQSEKAERNRSDTHARILNQFLGSGNDSCALKSQSTGSARLAIAAIDIPA